MRQWPALEELTGAEAPPAPQPDTGLRIFLTLDKLEFVPEEPLYVTLTFANVGTADVEGVMAADPITGAVEYILTDSSGRRCGIRKAVGDWPAGGPPSKVLHAGERYSECVDLSTQARPAPGEGVPISPEGSPSPLWRPETYTLRAEHRDPLPTADRPAPLGSNTVTLVVLGPEQMPEADGRAYGVLRASRSTSGSIWSVLGPRVEGHRRVAREFPGSGYAPWSRLRLAAALGRDGDTDAAVAAWQAIIRDLPGTRQAVEAQWWMSRALHGAKRHAEAAKAWGVLEHDPYVTDAKRESARFWRERAEQGKGL